MEKVQIGKFINDISGFEAEALNVTDVCEVYVKFADIPDEINKKRRQHVIDLNCKYIYEYAKRGIQL